MWKIVLGWNLTALFLALLLPWGAKYLAALACLFAMIRHLTFARGRGQGR